MSGTCKTAEDALHSNYGLALQNPLYYSQVTASDLDFLVSELTRSQLPRNRRRSIWGDFRVYLT
ncbi:hypothetical protein N658DRAFT_67180 [Parathielavia hyrcaniae]|uniref:Uncharacterized protein n=1 Tax=Parathielavia hyrcaniae TaxID=113614 RepID=A0AAN6Q562_9PEZI|nr:hypothetical protein N658DRAFT_67180 [Parathielavia hyrcaniae]